MPKTITDSDLENLLFVYEGIYREWLNSNSFTAHKLEGFCRVIYILELPIQNQMKDIREKILKESESK